MQATSDNCKAVDASGLHVMPSNCMSAERFGRYSFGIIASGLVLIGYELQMFLLGQYVLPLLYLSSALLRSIRWFHSLEMSSLTERIFLVSRSATCLSSRAPCRPKRAHAVTLRSPKNLTQLPQEVIAAWPRSIKHIAPVPTVSIRCNSGQSPTGRDFDQGILCTKCLLIVNTALIRSSLTNTGSVVATPCLKS